MKIDLFGGTGFIGSNYSKLYPDSTHIHDREDNVPVSNNVLYMISTTHNYHVFDDIHKDVDTNLTKLLKVLTNCKDKDIVFNFVSSWFVYGDVELPAKEDSNCKPKGFYSITKKCAEDLIISYCDTFKIKYRILRLCNVYGGDDLGVSKQKNALQYLIGEIKNNRDIKLYYDGQFIRDYMHVYDVCSAINLCINSVEYNQIINIGSGIPQNFREIIDFIFEETKSTSKIIPIDAADFHKIVQVKDMYMDTAKLKNLGFVQNISIEDGMRKLLGNS
jgi:nucleoside-diphosphate-sugar epimerase